MSKGSYVAASHSLGVASVCEEQIWSIFKGIPLRICVMKVMYGVYVVEQVGNTPFNRAMLMNVGAAEAVKQQVSNKTVFLWIFLTQILLRITNDIKIHRHACLYINHICFGDLRVNTHGG